MEEVELADALIRTLDLGGRCGWRANVTPYRLEGVVLNCAQNAPKTAGGLHLLISAAVTDIYNDIDPAHPYQTQLSYAGSNYEVLVANILAVGEIRGFDVLAAMEEKLEYNKQRLDHKRENRAQANGKKF